MKPAGAASTTTPATGGRQRARVDRRGVLGDEPVLDLQRAGDADEFVESARVLGEVECPGRVMEPDAGAIAQWGVLGDRSSRQHRPLEPMIDDACDTTRVVVAGEPTRVSGSIGRLGRTDADALRAHQGEVSERCRADEPDADHRDVVACAGAGAHRRDGSASVTRP